ncbi:MAG: hypothetical protein HQM12_10470 [SAR324 cluster bacterium]|nr:hypothetical protein [SAR324 cluster bacterium]
MPSLKDLKNPVAKQDFVAKVVAKASRFKDEQVSLNHGIKTSQELLDRFKKGDQVPFDYQRVLSDADKYE